MTINLDAIKDIVVALTALWALYYAWRKSEPEMRKMNSDTGKDVASIISQYETQITEMMGDRRANQEEILEMQQNLVRLQSEINKLKDENIQLENKCSVWYKSILEVVQSPLFILELPSTNIVDAN